MSQQNIKIGRENRLDLFYRYEMPLVQVTIIQKGRYNKTRIFNLYEIAKCLHIHISWLVKFIGIELGTQVKLEKKTKHVLVNGAHNRSTLAECIDDFVEMLILCPSQTCRKPELDMYMLERKRKKKNKKPYLMVSCRVCGYEGKMRPAHKIMNYIRSHPETTTSGF